MHRFDMKTYFRFADIRNTQQGKQEERMPMFAFIFPSWFSHKYPEAIANFRKNSKRLTTPFDINPTLKDLIHFSGAGHGDVRNRSISLFKDVSLITLSHIEKVFRLCTHKKLKQYNKCQLTLQTLYVQFQLGKIIKANMKSKFLCK